MEQNHAIEYLKTYGNRSVTENGALGKRTTFHALLDLNFKVSSLRSYSEEEIIREFIKAYYEDSVYAVKWLFFLRDVLEGMGERRSFRVCMRYLAQSHPDDARAVMQWIPEYGRYDDLLIFLDTQLCGEACRLMKDQLDHDLEEMQQGRPISLLAKWLPSANASSKQTKHYARILIKKFHMTEKQYRKTLAALRAYGNVVEVKLSANRWSEVAYDAVPAKANLKYENAFVKHDYRRRLEYLKQVYLGKSSLNTGGLVPHEIVHRILRGSSGYYGSMKDDMLAELMWEALIEEGFQNEWGLEDCIVVADGSGSMRTPVSGRYSLSAIEVCDALAIYFAEQLKGPFHNKAITFSMRPQFIDLDLGHSLKEKLEIMFSHNEVANTNIEAVFTMLLDMAKSHQVPADQLPKQVLIISDMEFDAATGKDPDTDLFESIAEDFRQAGYQMPRLIFWNVCGRTDTIPMVDNEQGVCLLSGFSVNAMKLAASPELTDPYERLIRILDSDRYNKIGEAIQGIAS